MPTTGSKVPLLERVRQDTGTTSEYHCLSVGDDQRLDSNMPIDIAPEYRRLAQECFSVAAQVDPEPFR
jgi:hypothetical protein